MITPLIATGTPSWLNNHKITGQPGRRPSAYRRHRRDTVRG
jgi:hypothetical protein